MKKVLIVVDMQKDFVDGSLGTKEAVSIVPEVVRLIEDEEYDTVIATLDTHTPEYLDTFEGKHLPVVHCVKHTEGWMPVPEVKEALAKRGAVYVEKPTFGSYELVDMIREGKPEEITLCGLCTDICVLSNALLLRAACYETDMKVVASACAGVTPAKHDAALEVMASCQIDIIQE